jgi:hypothetical protein
MRACFLFEGLGRSLTGGKAAGLKALWETSLKRRGESSPLLQTGFLNPPKLSGTPSAARPARFLDICGPLALDYTSVFIFGESAGSRPGR